MSLNSLALNKNHLSQPLVSIIVPVYNGAELISKTTYNLLEQSYQNIELILVNDGSTDDSGEVINELAKLDDRIISFHKTNGGVASARNFGIIKANGKFIALCNQDDFWKPEKLSQQMPLFDNPDTGLVYCGRMIQLLNGKEKKITIKNTKKGKVFEHLLQSNFINTIDTVIRKSLLKQVKGFDSDKHLLGVHDWHLWLKLSLITEFDFVPERLSIHVTHEKNNTVDEDLMHQTKLACIEKIRTEPATQQYNINWQDIIDAAHHNHLESYLNKSDFVNARRICQLIINNKPRQMLVYMKQLMLTSCPDSLIQIIQNIKRK